MKKTISLVMLLASLNCLAQSSVFQITDKNNSNNQIVLDGAVFYHPTKNLGSTINHEFEIKNVSASTVSLSLRKYEDLMNVVDASTNDVAQAYFCFGTNCLPSSVISYSIELQAGESTLLEAKFDEASVAGHSSVRYKFNDKTNTSDALILTLKYDTNVGLEEKNKTANYISEVYPNPASTDFNIDFLSSTIAINQINLLDASGRVQKQNLYQVSSNTKGIQINTSQLEAGIYFIQLLTNQGAITKKIILNN